jgi:UDP-N-acetylmuramate--alanine ligase
MAMSELAPHLQRPHFSGIAGTGMSALAEWMLRRGYAISGSDRSFDRGQEQAKRAHFLNLGASLHPQDGSGLTSATCLVVSTAIENSNPEVKAALERHLPVVHRSDLLQAIAASLQTVAISGTSGKSTVTGMAFHVLEAGGLGPSLISGANLPSIAERGMLGNAWAGKGHWLVMEADESDGTLVRYHPRIGVVLNIEKDHKEIAELRPLFTTFRSQTTGALIYGADDAEATALFAAPPNPAKPMTSGIVEASFDSKGITWQGRRLTLTDLRLEDWSSSFNLDGSAFHLSLPGHHNVMNALAAITVGLAAGLTLQQAADGLRAFKGVERRHIRVGEVRGITVVDDFAHNPAKVRACLTAVKNLAQKGRVLAVFHPHGFAPMKLMGRDIMDEAAAVLGPEDRLFLPDIYYAGGTADTSISSSDLANHLNLSHPNKAIARHLPTKAQVAAALVAKARPGDVLVNMGARDPGLGAFASELLKALTTGA